ncbi:MAG: hypothetical protein ACTHOU_16000, partial [Aureliella sp.]
ARSVCQSTGFHRKFDKIVFIDIHAPSTDPLAATIRTTVSRFFPPARRSDWNRSRLNAENFL